METMTANRISTHGPKELAPRKYRTHKCSHKGCSKAFTSAQALAMHVGRKHTHTIMNGKVHRKAHRNTKAAEPVVDQAHALLIGPGLRIEFHRSLLPTILHTIALSLGGKAGRP
jgi:hypothetical protein